MQSPTSGALKAAGDGKPLWLWGGGELFRSLAEAGLVDGVEVAVIPVILGGGVPLQATPGSAAVTGLAGTPALRRHRHALPRVRRAAGVIRGPRSVARPAAPRDAKPSYRNRFQ